MLVTHNMHQDISSHNELSDQRTYLPKFGVFLSFVFGEPSTNACHLKWIWNVWKVFVLEVNLATQVSEIQPSRTVAPPQTFTQVLHPGGENENTSNRPLMDHKILFKKLLYLK